MTSRELTPYDTGERLEPHPWTLGRTPLMTLTAGARARSTELDPDRYGLVDLDDDEGATVFTLVGKRHDDGAPGRLLSISTYTDDTTIEVDGDRVLVLDEGTLAGLSALVELAHRGCDDFQHQAGSTRDYSEEDVREADDALRLAQQTIMKIQGARP